MSEIEFWVIGKPQPAGSKRAFRNPHSGRINVVDANRNAGAYKQQVAAAALDAHDGELLTGSLELTLIIRLARPKGHYGTGRNAHRLKPSAPHYPTTKPDLLKLARGVEDALTGVVWRDDAQIVVEHLTKRYATSDEPESVHVVIRPGEQDDLARLTAGHSEGVLARA